MVLVKNKTFKLIYYTIVVINYELIALILWKLT